MKAIYHAMLTTGNYTLACEKHARQLKSVASAIGTDALILPYAGDEECENCINESKSAKNSVGTL